MVASMNNILTKIPPDLIPNTLTTEQLISKAKEMVTFIQNVGANNAIATGKIYLLQTLIDSIEKNISLTDDFKISINGYKKRTIIIRARSFGKQSNYTEYDFLIFKLFEIASK